MNMRRRLPAIEKQIHEIKPEKDIRVRILGAVIGYGQPSILLDDGTGNVEIMFNHSPSYISQGQIIKVITRILPQSNGFQCRGECIQLVDGLDINLYKESKKIIGKG